MISTSFTRREHGVPLTARSSPVLASRQVRVSTLFYAPYSAHAAPHIVVVAPAASAPAPSPPPPSDLAAAAASGPDSLIASAAALDPHVAG